MLVRFILLTSMMPEGLLFFPYPREKPQRSGTIALRGAPISGYAPPASAKGRGCGLKQWLPRHPCMIPADSKRLASSETRAIAA